LDRRQFVTGAASTVVVLAGISPVAGATPNEIHEGSLSMIITEDDVIKHATRYFTALRTGATPDELTAFFLNPCPRIYFADSGKSIDMTELHDFHRQFEREKMELSRFNVMALSEEPARARTLGTVYWEAVSGEADKTINSVVGEDWILERTPGGDLKFVLYINTFHHQLPNSAPFPF
jgi:hypothetical protein